MDLTDSEVCFLADMLEEEADRLRHYPKEYTQEQSEAYFSLEGKLSVEAKRRGFWWAQ